MTWVTTHFALEGMIAYLFIGYALRNKFLHSNGTRALFILTNFFAVIPDFDVEIGLLLNNRMHRGLSHSIFFPFTLLLIGIVILGYNKYKSSKPDSPFANPDKLFEQQGTTKNQILYLLPYVFFIGAFLWGFHIVLDMDAAEGGMMLFWPLDNRLYEVSLIFKLSAYPFLLLPWTPLGASFQVSQSTIIGLYNYLFNWSPQQFLAYTGSTTFNYNFVGLFLHTSIFITYIYFVLRPMWPLQGKNLGQKLDLFHFFSKLKRYWQSLIKEILIPGFMIFFIGFTFGPLVTPVVPDQQPITGSLSFTNNTFNFMDFFPLDAISQPLDPGAQFIINATYSATNFTTGDSMYFVIGKLSLFTNIQYEVNNLLSTINTTAPPTTDSSFKASYLGIITEGISNGSTIYFVRQDVNMTNVQVPITKLDSSQSYGVGFILLNWASKPFWNETNTQIQINGSLNVDYTRYVNYWIGMTIESIGLLVMLVALALPFKKKSRS